MASTSTISVPVVISKFFSKFPLYTYPEDDSQYEGKRAQQSSLTLWISLPKTPSDVLSANVECLKWQAYIALRGVKNVGVRWDIAPEGAAEGRLPSLLVYANGKPEVLSARMIPGVVDNVLQAEDEAFEGYKDAAAKDESRAWVSLLEGTVESALTLFNPMPMSLTSLLLYKSRPSRPAQHTLSRLLTPPPAPLSGSTSLFPPYGERLSLSTIQSQYHDAILSLSDRLGDDTWILGSSGPTALDALVFAYLHCLLATPDDLRLPVVRRTNLVNYERRVRDLVREAFVAV